MESSVMNPGCHSNPHSFSHSWPSWPLVAMWRHDSVTGRTEAGSLAPSPYRVQRNFGARLTSWIRSNTRLMLKKTTKKKLPDAGTLSNWSLHSTYTQLSLLFCSLCIMSRHFCGQRQHSLPAVDVDFPFYPFLFVATATPSRFCWIKFNKCPPTSHRPQHLIKGDQSFQS